MDLIQDFRTLEEQLWRAETRFDLSFMETVLAPDFFEFGRSGRRYSRAECLDMGPLRDIPCKFPLEDFLAHPIDTDTVLVTYISELAHQPVERANRSSIWIRTEGGWKLRFHQGTPTS